MLNIASLTNSEAVLTSAGLTTGDISEQRLINSGIEDDLVMHLIKIIPTYEALLAAAVTAGASQQAKNIAIAIKNYAKWWCAATLAGRPALYKQLVSDGKARNDRFDRMDFAAMKANIDGMVMNALGDLQSMLNPEVPGVYSPPSFFSKSTPSFDPVTEADD